MSKFNNKPNWKIVANKSSIGAIVFFIVFAFLEYVMQNYDWMQVFGYGAGFSFLIWFSTRKNGCGSCNQEA
jgi:dolichol kinase